MTTEERAALLAWLDERMKQSRKWINEYIESDEPLSERYFIGRKDAYDEVKAYLEGEA